MFSFAPHQFECNDLVFGEGLRVGANAFRAAFVAPGAPGSCRTVHALAVGIEALSIGVEAPAVGIAALEVSVEESKPAYLLGAAAIAIRPESSWTWAAIALVAPAPTLALGSVIPKGNYKCACVCVRNC